MEYSKNIIWDFSYDSFFNIFHWKKKVAYKSKVSSGPRCKSLLGPWGLVKRGDMKRQQSGSTSSSNWAGVLMHMIIAKRMLRLILCLFIWIKHGNTQTKIYKPSKTIKL